MRCTSGVNFGPLTFQYDIFYFVSKCDITNYADDTNPYSVEETMDTLLASLETDTSTRDNYVIITFKLMPINAICSFQSIAKKYSLMSKMRCISSVKLLGATIANKLNFDEHITKLSKKASQKIHALARISNFMSLEKLCIIMKAFIESQLGHCPLIWMFHSRTLNNRINRLLERALSQM